MTTEDLTQHAEYCQARLPQLSGPFAHRVTKKEWPKAAEQQIVEIIPLRYDSRRRTSFASTIRSYRLQHTAVDSEDILTDADDMEVADIREAFTSIIVSIWEDFFASKIAEYIENRALVTTGTLLHANTDFLLLKTLPRRSLFGRKVCRYQEVEGQHVFNLKYDRCPHQWLEFNPDTVHFLFPDLENWAGNVSYHEKRDPLSLPFFRVVMQVAAKPVRTDLGKIYTVLPKGWRGKLYRVVWKLLGVKP